MAAGPRIFQSREMGEATAMPHAPHRALVTGGAGFIGSHLAEYLLEQGAQVTCLDDLSTGRVANVAHLEGNPRFRLLVGNAGEPELLREAARGAKTIFHLAAAVGVKRVMADPVDTMERNLHTTEAVLRLASQYRHRLVITSTSEVYGSGSREWFREDDDALIGDPTKRRWGYAASKLADEFHAFAYHHATGLAVTVARMFNTIGPRQVGHYGMVVPTLVRQALSGQPLTVYGDGLQRRSFTWIGDAVRALAGLAAEPSTAGQVYNVGSSEEATILDLANRILRATGAASAIRLVPYEEAYGYAFHDIERRRPETSKLRKALGWSPDTPLDQALEEVIKHEKSLIA